MRRRLREFGRPSNGGRILACDSTCIHIHLQGTWQFMSTRLLTDPGSKHTITDDLESHYFVLMWTALHWVKHNRPGEPGIDMENIFDQQRPIPGGIVKGGAGKLEMYGSRGSELHEVEFFCRPFDELFWELWMLFGGYLAQRREAARKRDPGPGEYPNRDPQSVENSDPDVDSEPSVSPQEVIDLFEAALKQPGWIDDKVADQLPRVGSKNASGIPLSEMDNGVINHGNPGQGKKRGLSKSLGIDLEQLPAKRQKGGRG